MIIIVIYFIKAFLFEGMFGFWAGWRGYHMGLSMQTQDMVEEITKIPLVEGRSIISDELCHDLNTLIHDEIPKVFWKNLDVNKNNSYEDGLKHEETWRNIIKFCDNCSKRKVYEDMIRNRNGRITKNNIEEEEEEDDHVLIPSPGVPEDIVTDKKLIW